MSLLNIKKSAEMLLVLFNSVESRIWIVRLLPGIKIRTIIVNDSK